MRPSLPPAPERPSCSRRWFEAQAPLALLIVKNSRGAARFPLCAPPRLGDTVVLRRAYLPGPQPAAARGAHIDVILARASLHGPRAPLSGARQRRILRSAGAARGSEQCRRGEAAADRRRSAAERRPWLERWGSTSPSGSPFPGVLPAAPTLRACSCGPSPQSPKPSPPSAHPATGSTHCPKP